MKRLLLEFTNKTIDEKVAIERDFLWFNVEDGKLEKFRGGKLIFENGKPKTALDFHNKKKSIKNKDDILKWIDVHGKQYEIEIVTKNNNGILIEYKEKHSDQIEYSLDRHLIKYSKD